MTQEKILPIEYYNCTVFYSTELNKYFSIMEINGKKVSFIEKENE